MSKLDHLWKARDSYSVAFFTFIKLSTSHPGRLLCFFEGDDVKYCGPRIEMLCPNIEWQPIECGGKTSVIKLYHLITNHAVYNQKNAAYFIDNDFGLYPVPHDPTRLYCTPCYSIENFYVTPRVISRVLEAEFRLSREPDDEGYFRRSIDAFVSCLEQFIEQLRLLDAWIYAHRVSEHNAQSGRLLRISDIKISQFFQINLNSVASKYTIFDLETQTGHETPVSDEVLRCYTSRVAREERVSKFRGKFLTYFVRTFLCSLADAASSGDATFFPEKRRGLLRPSERNFLSELSQYAETPDCLRHFLHNLSSAN